MAARESITKDRFMCVGINYISINYLESVWEEAKFHGC
jgi:hypothetical protein